MGQGIISVLIRYFHTIRYLKVIQIRYRIFYYLRRRWHHWNGFQYPLKKTPYTSHLLRYSHLIPRQKTWHLPDHHFTFLNQSQTFGLRVDWSFKSNGKLWQYNLHYFDYLLQEDASADAGLALMRNFIDQLPQVPEALEPYPTSLRLIFWIQFLSKHQIQAPDIDAALYAQAYRLADHLEYHILGNHLMENGFGLLFASYYFQDKKLQQIASHLLLKELPEQILMDGAHFERSPMYHQIILHRLLDTYDLLTLNTAPIPTIHTALITLVKDRTLQMLDWLQNMSFANGETARFNDTVAGIAPTTAKLLTHAERLGLISQSITSGIQKSGYFWYSGTQYKIIVDVGVIGPDYQPGHAHCDMLSFEMHIENRPILVNTGISTYEKNARRQYERSTAAHNTVQIGNEEQSEVWGGFRVARRARPLIQQSSEDAFEATHTGYDQWHLRHTRSIACAKKSVNITDTVIPYKGKSTQFNLSKRAYFHFHPDVRLTKHADRLSCSEVDIMFSGYTNITVETYEYAAGFNLQKDAQRAVVEFEETLQTLITINS